MLRKSRWPRSSDRWHARANEYFPPLLRILVQVSLKTLFQIDDTSTTDNVLLVYRYTSKILIVSFVKTSTYKLVFNKYGLKASYLAFRNTRMTKCIHACDLTLHFAKRVSSNVVLLSKCYVMLYTPPHELILSITNGPSDRRQRRPRD